MIPIDRITIVNPRLRSKKTFKGIFDNITEIGLKRPITVTARQGEDGLVYDLVCGQGRLEAFRELDQTEVPALIVAADAEDCRSEERRVGKACVSTCRSRWSPSH